MDHMTGLDGHLQDILSMWIKGGLKALQLLVWLMVASHTINKFHQPMPCLQLCLRFFKCGCPPSAPPAWLPLACSSASQSVPVVFALTRKRLGKIYGCRKRVSAVALLDYHGVEALHERMIQLVHEGHEAWGKLHASGEKQPHILVDEGGGEAGDDDDDDDDDEDDEEEEYEVGNDGNADDDDVLEHAG
eukprot:217760-Chlamydomonas_euryale.AAC.4